jgi:hypothetical protein
MIYYLWYILCFNKIHQIDEDDWGHFVDLDE